MVKGAPSIRGKSSYRSFSSQSINQKDEFVIDIDRDKNLNELNELNLQLTKYKSRSEKDFIPCMFLRGKSKKVLIHFHANGEDLFQTK